MSSISIADVQSFIDKLKVEHSCAVQCLAPYTSGCVSDKKAHAKLKQRIKLLSSLITLLSDYTPA